MKELSPDIRDSMKEVCAQRLMDHTKIISSEVRLSGSPEELRAFYYVQSVLQSLSIEATLQFHKALISLPQFAEVHIPALGVRIPCITHSFSANFPQGREAELSYVGVGASQRDYERADVGGKITLHDGIAMPVKVHYAEKMGCVGQIHINDEHVHEMIVSTVWGSPSLQTVDKLPTVPVVSVTAKDGKTIKGLLSTHGRLTVRITTSVLTEWRDIPLLTADIRGPAKGDEYVLLSGHVDSWHYGAMDNAAANATMLEVARVLSLRRDLLRRHLRLAFWSGHSHGRYAGSAWYADNNWLDLHKNCVVHINVDSTGGIGATIVNEAPVMPETYEVARDVVAALTGEELHFKLIGRAGDQSFWGLGIPSLFINVSEQVSNQSAASSAFQLLTGQPGIGGGGLGWWWHTSEDLIDKIDADNLLRDTRIYLAVTMRFCTDRVLPLKYSAHVEWLLKQLNELECPDDVHHLKAVKAMANELLVHIRQLERLLFEEGYEDLKNSCLIRLGRLLVPSAMTSGDPFEHDPALPTRSIPLLDCVRAMADCEVDSDRYNLLRVAAVRNMNRLHYNLFRALELVKCTLNNISTTGGL
ncbi:MAG: M28 family peptidase [Bacillota bacterium]